MRRILNHLASASISRAVDTLDRVVASVSPSMGVARIKDRYRINAYSEAGYVVPGSKRKAMKGFRARANSPSADIIAKLPGMRGASRDLFMNSPLAVSILERRKTHDIGSGLQFQSRIDGTYLGLDDKQKDVKRKEIEREFDMWSESFHSDFDGLNYYGDNQALGFINMLLSGDYFVLPVWRDPKDPFFPYRLCIKLIDADLVRDPSLSKSDRDIEGGVELDKNGGIAGYHVWNTYPGEGYTKNKKAESKFVPAFDASGRQQIFHVFDPKRIKQRRGVPLLAPVAEPLKQMTRLADAELMNSLVSSFFTVFVRDQSGMGQLIPETIHPDDTAGGGGNIDPDSDTEYEKDDDSKFDLEMGHGNVTYLDDDKDVTIANPNKTDRDFGTFWDALGTQSTAVGGVPFERAMLKYTASYTAARAATNDAWLGSLNARTLITRRMNVPVQNEFFEEAIARGRLNLPRYYDDYSFKRAWTKSVWIGYGQGYLNPLQEAKADALRINSKTTTRGDVYEQRGTGGRWESAMDRRAAEDRLLESLGISDEPDPDELVGPDGQVNQDQQDAEENKPTNKQGDNDDTA